MTLDENLKKQVEEEVIAIASEELGRKFEEVKRESRFIEDLGSDSLTQVELIMKLEGKYDLKIEDVDAQKLQTVGNAVDYILDKKYKK